MTPSQESGAARGPQDGAREGAAVQNDPHRAPGTQISRDFRPQIPRSCSWIDKGVDPESNAKWREREDFHTRRRSARMFSTRSYWLTWYVWLMAEIRNIVRRIDGLASS
jgi:hypothetical protein